MKKICTFVINKENKILLLLGSDKDPQFHRSFWYVVTGGCEDYDDTIEDTVKREVKEETNLDVVSVKSYIGSFDYISGSGKKSRQYNFVLDVKNTGNIILTEHDEYNWLTIEEIRKSSKITDEVKYILEICYFNLKD